MPLTNDTGIQAQERVATDIRLGQNKTLPSGQVLSPEAQILLNGSIVARKLGKPSSEEIHIKRTDLYFRWVNRRGAGGSIYAQRVYQGFRNATTEDAEPKSVLIRAEADGKEIVHGDCILMCLPMEIYQSAIKANMEESMRLTRMRGVGYDQTPSTDINSDSNSRRTSVADQKSEQFTHFIPTQEELEAKMPQKGRRGN